MQSQTIALQLSQFIGLTLLLRLASSTGVGDAAAMVIAERNSIVSFMSNCDMELTVGLGVVVDSCPGKEK